jgi:hypothetical protein
VATLEKKNYIFGGGRVAAKNKAIFNNFLDGQKTSK